MRYKKLKTILLVALFTLLSVICVSCGSKADLYAIDFADSIDIPLGKTMAYDLVAKHKGAPIISEKNNEFSVSCDADKDGLSIGLEKNTLAIISNAEGTYKLTIVYTPTLPEGEKPITITKVVTVNSFAEPHTIASASIGEKNVVKLGDNYKVKISAYPTDSFKGLTISISNAILRSVGNNDYSVSGIGEFTVTISGRFLDEPYVFTATATSGNANFDAFLLENHSSDHKTCLPADLATLSALKLTSDYTALSENILAFFPSLSQLAIEGQNMENLIITKLPYLTKLSLVAMPYLKSITLENCSGELGLEVTNCSSLKTLTMQKCGNVVFDFADNLSLDLALTDITSITLADGAYNIFDNCSDFTLENCTALNLQSLNFAHRISFTAKNIGSTITNVTFPGGAASILLENVTIVNINGLNSCSGAYIINSPFDYALAKTLLDSSNIILLDAVTFTGMPSEDLVINSTSLRALTLQNLSQWTNISITAPNLVSFEFSKMTTTKLKIYANVVEPFVSTYENIISDCPNLTTLDAKYLKKLTISNIPSIEWLQAEACELKTLDSSSFQSLKTLILNSNNLKELNLQGRQGLQYLEVSANAELQKVNISSCAALKIFLAKDCAISEITTDSAPYTLEMLQVNDNNLETLGFLSNITSLKTLDCANNKLSNVSALAKLTNLQELYLGYNPFLSGDIEVLRTQLNTISSAVKTNLLRLSLSCPEQLDAAQSNLMVSTVSAMTSLTWLELNSFQKPDSDNDSVLTPFKLGKLNELVYLDIRRNGITTSLSSLKSIFPKLTTYYYQNDESVGNHGSNLGSNSAYTISINKETYTITNL